MSILDRIFGDPGQETAVTGKTYLIVGLGNPGKKYRTHRHNIGFMAIDQLAHSYNATLSQVKNKAIVGGLPCRRSQTGARQATNLYELERRLSWPFGQLLQTRAGAGAGHL